MNKFMLLLFMVLAVSASSISADPVPDKDKVQWAGPMDCIPQAIQMSTFLPSVQTTAAVLSNVETPFGPQANQMSTFLPGGEAVADAVLPTVEILSTPTPCSDMLQECFDEDEDQDSCWPGWCICVIWYYGEDDCGA